MEEGTFETDGPPSPGRRRRRTGSTSEAIDGPRNPLIDAGASADAIRAPLEEASGMTTRGESEDDGAEQPTLQETLSGGPSLIFAMARRMLVWDDENYAGGATAGAGGATGAVPPPPPSVPSSSSPSSAAAQRGGGRSGRPPVLPRWHPHPGVSDVNPSFRKRSPVMNNAGYLGVIRRNSRKRSKPSLWRYSLRTYDKMRIIEREQEERERIKRESGEGVGGVSGSGRKRLVIRRTTPHHEAAMVSCAKLGLWREAIRIYEEITGRRNHSRDEDALQLKAAVGVTENLVLALVRACVRGSKVKGRVVEEEPTVDDRRAPLDKARGVLLSLQVSYYRLRELSWSQWNAKIDFSPHASETGATL